MQNSPSFFSDPKVIISILALVVSVTSIIWTLANQWEQNRRWDNLNRGNPEIKEARMIKWREYTIEEAKTIDWGYEPDLYGIGEATGKVIIPYRLIVRDKNDSVLSNVNSVFTIQKLEQELKRIDFKDSVYGLTEVGRFSRTLVIESYW